MLRSTNVYKLNKRVVGYFEDIETAKEVVEDNAGGIHECGHFPYCVVEEQAEGLYGMNNNFENAWWYKWDDKEDAFKPIDKPESLEIAVMFGMG